MTDTDLDPAALADALNARLDEAPSDAVTRLMLADLLEAQGDRVLAQGQRWQALHGRWPARGVGPGSLPDWRWWDGDFSDNGDPDDVPPDAYRLLRDGTDKGSGMARHYPSRRAAEDDLALALEALAQRGGTP